MREHELENHLTGCPYDPDSHSCPICDGGLALCRVCRGVECSLPTECPGRELTDQEEDDICAGRLDYINGKWINDSELPETNRR